MFLTFNSSKAVVRSMLSSVEDTADIFPQRVVRGDRATVRDGDGPTCCSIAL